MEKEWSFEDARDHYLANKKIRDSKIKSCKKCKFAHTPMYLSCEVRGAGKQIYLPMLKAMRCMYYTIK